MASPYTRSITAVESLDGFLLYEALGGSLDHDEAFGGCLDPDEGFCGRHDTLVVHALAALLPSHAQRARLECGTVLQADFFDKTSRSNF